MIRSLFISFSLLLALFSVAEAQPHATGWFNHG